MMDVYVERLYSALTEALRRSRPRPFDAPVSVAAIYEELIPYRVVRTPLGFAMNADYEHALARLLAGAGDLVRLEPESAAAELREELSSPNPDVSLVRRFGACEVWVAAPADGPGQTPVARRTEAAAPGTETVTATAASGPRKTQQDRKVETAPVHPPIASDAGPAQRREADLRCEFCFGTLPAGRPVRFCPHCGADLTRRPCVACGYALEREWRYCVACGAQQPGDDSA